MNQELIDQIQSQADIVQVISNYIEVIKKGKSYVAVCPFHADHDPSLQISQEKQIYKCFACGAGGTVFNFVQEYEHVGFFEAVRIVARIIGFNDPSLEAPARNIAPETKKILDCLNTANETYQYLLKSNDGIVAKKYLQDRNLSDEIQEYFGLGFASTNAELPIKLLRNKGFDVDTLDKAGILVRSGDTFVDRFSYRITFPIYNEHSEVIGFSARRIIDSDAMSEKYKNSPGTAVFTKSNILFNYQNAKVEAKKENRVYVTEGQMDVIALYKAGVKSAVALMGSALTEHHAKMLKKLGVEIILCLDGDEAGQKGMIKAGIELTKLGISYKVVDYKECKLDPDEILQQYGEKILAKFLNRIISKNNFIYKYYQKKYDLKTVDGKTHFAQELIPYISNITNAIERDLMIKKVCEDTGIDKTSYEALLVSKKDEIKQIDFNVLYAKRKQKIAIKGLVKLQKEILFCMIDNTQAIEDYKDGHAYFIDDVYERIANYVLDYYEVNGNVNVSSIINSLSSVNYDSNKTLISEITGLNKEDLNSPGYKQDSFLEFLERMRKEVLKKSREDQYIRSIEGKSIDEQAHLLESYIQSLKKEEN